MIRILMPLVDGFEEVEAVTPADMLRRAGVEVVLAGVDSRRVTGSHGIAIEADARYAEVKGGHFEGIVLPGGPGTRALNAVPGLHALLREYHAERRLLGAICAAPTVLAAAGVLRGLRATCFPSCEGDLTGAELVREPVVRAGHIITSRGAGTALPFALALVEHLCGRDAAHDLSRQIVAEEYAGSA